MKISIIGAGNVGATTANFILKGNLAKEIVLLDVKPGLAEGKALDIAQSCSINESGSKIIGVTGDYYKTSGSDIVVVTAGVARQPGVSRESIVGKNSEIIKSVVKNIVSTSPNAIIINVTNPLDIITRLIVEESGFNKSKVLGMGSILDTARYKYFISEKLGVNVSQVEGMVIGAHSSTMVPLVSRALVNGKLISELLSEIEISEIINKTISGGSQIGELLGISAWSAPAEGVVKMIKNIQELEDEILPVSVWVDGEYGVSDSCIGVPVRLGRDGVREIVEFGISEGEMEGFKAGALNQLS